MQASDPTWPRLLSLSVHELRTPASVVSGYQRMVLTERAGAVPEAQRRFLEEAEKSCRRISELLADMSDLAHIELGDAPFRRETVDLAALVREVVEGTARGDDLATVTLKESATPAVLQGDPARLRAALMAIVRCVQRETVTSDGIVVHRTSEPGWVSIAVGRADAASALAAAGGRASSDSVRFDELRGGMGVALPIARRVVERHGGRLIVLSDQPNAVALLLPLALEGRSS
jgi:signal transduction histidine kinase